MIAAFSKAISQLSEPSTRGVLWKSLLGTAVIYVLLVAALWMGLSYTALFTLPWLEVLVDVLGGLAVFLIALIFFPAIATGVLSLFLESIAGQVEDRHYPDLEPAPEPRLRDEIVNGLKFAGITVLLNLLALPFYLIPIINLFVFYGLNGYLLSREYFELVALRRLDRHTTDRLRKTHLGSLWLAGALITFLLTIPVVNLVAPVVATAFMVHLFERIRRKHQAAG